MPDVVAQVLMSHGPVTFGVHEYQTSLSTATLQAVAGPSSNANRLFPLTPAGPVPAVAMAVGAVHKSFAGATAETGEITKAPPDAPSPLSETRILYVPAARLLVR